MDTPSSTHRRRCAENLATVYKNAMTPSDSPALVCSTWNYATLVSWSHASRRNGVGFTPQLPIAPTRQGILDGRDEVLEAALERLGTGD